MEIAHGQREEPYGPTGTVIEVEWIGDESIASVTVRWDNGPLETFKGKDLEGDNGPFIWDLTDVTPELYVNVYLHDRAYGGPQEGGWWYDTYDPVTSQCVLATTEDEATRLYDEKKAWCEDHNVGRRDIGSVLSTGRYTVSLEAWPAEPKPSRTPHYC